MEDVVDAVALLRNDLSACVPPFPWGFQTCDGYHTLAAKAIHLLASRPSLVLVVIMQNLHLLTKLTRSSTFSLRDGSWMFFAV